MGAHICSFCDLHINWCVPVFHSPSGVTIHLDYCIFGHFWKNLYPLRIDNLSKKPEISHISQSASLSWFGRGQHIIFNNLFRKTSKYLGAIKLSKETTNYIVKSHLNNQKLVKPIHRFWSSPVLALTSSLLKFCRPWIVRTAF